MVSLDEINAIDGYIKSDVEANKSSLLTMCLEVSYTAFTCRISFHKDRTNT